MVTAVFSRTKSFALGDNHGTADVAAESKGNKDQGDLIAVAHGGQRLFADEFAGYQRVGDIVKLLKDNASEQGKAESPQHCFRFAFCQVFVHQIRSLLLCSLLLFKKVL